MDVWDQEFVDLVVPGHFTIGTSGNGGFEFGAVFGQMDCHVEKQGNRERLAFTWEGNDECDPANGRGWITVKGDQMKGHIYFHLGDDSGFAARKGT